MDPPHDSRAEPATWRWTSAVLLLFVLLAAVGVLRHEMWRDELEIWLVARDSGSPFELFRNIATEGHPILWYLLVWCATRLTDNPVSMQFLSVAIGTATVFLVLRYAPFTRLQRALFCLGYFPLYEYTILSRNYGVEMLLAVAVAALWERRREHWLRLGAVLFLLAQSHLYGAIVATCFALWILLEAARARTLVGRPGAAGLVALAGVGLGVGQVAYQAGNIGPAHNDFVPGWSLRWLADGFATVCHGYLPLSDPTNPHGWNSSLLALVADPFGPAIGAVAGVALLALSAWALRRRREALGVFLLGTATMLTVTLFFWHTWLRHHGQIWLLFVICLWLATVAGGRRRWFTAVLVVQLLAAAQAWAADARRPFSCARETARWLSRPEHRDAILVGSVDFAAQAVAGFLKRPIYYPQSGRFGTFVRWGPERQTVPATKVGNDAEALVHEHHRDALVILNYEPQSPPIGGTVQVAPDVAVEGLAQFRGAIVGDEEFFVFRVFETRSYDSALP